MIIAEALTKTDCHTSVATQPRHPLHVLQNTSTELPACRHCTGCVWINEISQHTNHCLSSIQINLWQILHPCTGSSEFHAFPIGGPSVWITCPRKECPQAGQGKHITEPYTTLNSISKTLLTTELRQLIIIQWCAKIHQTHGTLVCTL